MKLTLQEIDKDGVIHLTADGQITSLDFHENNRNPLEALIGADWTKNKVVLDLDKVSYVDSTAIGWLVSCHKQFKQAGGMMVLHSIHPSVQQVFDMLKIGSLFPLAKDRPDAQAITAGDQAEA